MVKPRVPLIAPSLPTRCNTFVTSVFVILDDFPLLTSKPLVSLFICTNV